MSIGQQAGAHPITQSECSACFPQNQSCGYEAGSLETLYRTFSQERVGSKRWHDAGPHQNG